METASAARAHLPGEMVGDEPTVVDESGGPPPPPPRPLAAQPDPAPAMPAEPIDEARPPLPVPSVPVPSLDAGPEATHPEAQDGDSEPDGDLDAGTDLGPPADDQRRVETDEPPWHTRVTPIPPAAADSAPPPSVLGRPSRAGRARVITGAGSASAAPTVEPVVKSAEPVTVLPAPITAPPAPAPPSRSTPPTEQPTAPTAEQLPPPPNETPAAPPSESPAIAPLAEDAEGFAPSVSAKLKSYVYLLVDPRTGRAFYVGKGRNDRCFRHIRAAGAGSGGPPGPGSADDSKYPMLDKIREVQAGGRAVRIDILRYGLSPEEAALVEAAVHEALGFSGPPAAGAQRQSTEEISSHLAKRAKFKRSHQVVLLRVGAKGTDSSYESARHGWRVGKRWIDLESPRSPKWAVIVVGDVVASVHRIEGWDPAPLRGRSRHTVVETTARSTYRYSFSGAPDPELERRYVGKSVASYLGAGTPSPVTYVWCGPHWVNTPG